MLDDFQFFKLWRSFNLQLHPGTAAFAEGTAMNMPPSQNGTVAVLGLLSRSKAPR